MNHNIPSAAQAEQEQPQLNPEVQARVDFGTMLVDAAAEWTENNGSSDGDSGNGMKFEDFKTVLGKEYPDMQESDLDTAAAEFTRDVAWFKYGKSAEEDLSTRPVAESVSRTATFSPSDVMKYTVHKLKETGSFNGTSAEQAVAGAVDRQRAALGYQPNDEVTEMLKKEVLETV